MPAALRKYTTCPVAEFLDVIGTKVLRVTSTTGFYSPHPSPLEKSGLKLGCNVNIVYGNLKFVNSQDYAQKRYCTFMNWLLVWG